jgi:hypothetical protein
MPSRSWPRLGCFGGIVASLILGLVVVFAVTALLTPWAFHIGGQWTPGTWSGYGTLRTTAGDQYPLFIDFFPDFRSMTHLGLNGQRPVSGLRGMGWLCSAQGMMLRLDLSGDMYGSRFNTDGDQMGIRLLDARHLFQFNPPRRRYFDLLGRWHGGEVAMQDDGGWERGFHPDPHDPKARASVTFTVGSYSDFKNLCNATAIPEKARIAPPRD